MPLQSAIFTINRTFIIGLVSSIITAVIGYGIRLILWKYLEYDIFTNLDNWIVSLSYFCSLGGTSFVIKEYLKENTYQMSYRGDPMAVSNNTAGKGSLPVGSNAAGYNSSMQAPNNSGSSSAGDNSATGSSSAGDASMANDRAQLQEKIRKKRENILYFKEQFIASNSMVNTLLTNKPLYVAAGNEEDWNYEYSEALSALEDTKTNLSSEIRMRTILQRNLENGNYTMSAPSTTTKRGFSDSSMANDASSKPSNKRPSDNP
jgi:hypothetical protein